MKLKSGHLELRLSVGLYSQILVARTRLSRTPWNTLELIRQSRQISYIFNVKVHPRLEQ